MMYLYGYEDIKRVNEERQHRSLARYRLQEQARSSLITVERDTEAEIVEIHFGSQCESHQIGA